MKSLILGLAVAATALFVGGIAPAAQACTPPNGCDPGPQPPPTSEESQFIAQMKNIGVTASSGHDSSIMSAGYLLCQAHWWQGGLTPAMMEGLLRLIDYRDFNDINSVALKYLCPTSSGWGGRPGVG